MSLILMKNPKIKMNGPEHHFLVTAVLLSTYYNKKKDFRKKEDKIKGLCFVVNDVKAFILGYGGKYGYGYGKSLKKWWKF